MGMVGGSLKKGETTPVELAEGIGLKSSEELAEEGDARMVGVR